MTQPPGDPEFVIDAFVAQPERPALHSAVRLLTFFLKSASASPQAFKLNLRGHPGSASPGEEPGVVILSLLDELTAPNAPLADTAVHWKQRISALMEETARPIFLCTIFRHVPSPGDASAGAHASRLRERIRRLNLLALELSQATGANVIDVDRTLAHFGARLLQTDFSLRGRLAPVVAGEIIAGTLLNAGLDDFVDAAALEKARRAHGGMRGIALRLQNHLATQARAATPETSHAAG